MIEYLDDWKSSSKNPGKNLIDQNVNVLEFLKELFSSDFASCVFLMIGPEVIEFLLIDQRSYLIVKDFGSALKLMNNMKIS